jgi:hypothetical protein
MTLDCGAAWVASAIATVVFDTFLGRNALRNVSRIDGEFGYLRE